MTGRRYDPFKRGVDVVVAAVLLIVTSPVQVVVALLVRLRLGSPVLFRQLRPGKEEKVFELVKFRTMLPEDPIRGLLSDDDRLTPFGQRLRATSLDELPTLWNVVWGEMSLVGPRPLLVRYLDRYSAAQRRRHEVRPGITGLAQVSGRNAISWDDRLRLDIEYVERRSAALDAKILFRTISGVVRREGISGEGTATMAEFLGSYDED